ncbi:MAG: DUF6077 domain-containing protein, partial [Actinomycetota bacterium]
FLFVAPGMVLSLASLRGCFPGAALLPAAFVISTSIFGLMAVPFLVLHLSLTDYLWAAGTVVAASLASATALAIFRPGMGEAGGGGSPERWLWMPFLALGGVLAYAAWIRVPHIYEDIWVYLAYVRDFLESENLAAREPYFGRETDLSRVLINGWLLTQAALSRVSGADPVELVLRYEALVLIFMSLLAFYALARVAIRNPSGALFAACTYALLFVVGLDFSIRSDSGEFVGRIAEDKFAARFLFLPVALALAASYLEAGRLRHLAFFALVVWGMMAVHPAGFAITGLSMAGFALVYLAFNVRLSQAWTRIAGLAAAGVSVLALPGISLYAATGDSLTAILKDADINSHDPEVLANMVFVRPGRERIFELGDGLYIMHPSLLLSPVVILGFLVGLPFLATRLNRSLGAQMLAGVLVLATVVCYAPPVATFVGDHIVLPGQLWRLAWPIPLAAALAFGWAAWRAFERTRDTLGGAGLRGRFARALLPALALAMAVAAAPHALAGVEDVRDTSKVSCLDPIFAWMGENIEEPSVVLAPDAQNTCIPAFSAEANVVSLRAGLVFEVLPELQQRAHGEVDVPRGDLDVRDFFSPPTTYGEGMDILRRYGADYVLAYKGSPLDAGLRRLTDDFEYVETPGETYSLYEVIPRRQELPEKQA